jgi:hypothetical protein
LAAQHFSTAAEVCRLSIRWSMEFRFNSGDLQFTASVDGESNFDVAFKSQWNKAVEAGACRYLLTNLRTKILSGKYRHVAQVTSPCALIT